MSPTANSLIELLLV